MTESAEKSGAGFGDRQSSAASLKRRFYEGQHIEGLSEDFDGIGISLSNEFFERLQFYGSDLIDGLTFKSLSSALAMFFTTYFATLSLGTHVQEATSNRIGLQEYLLFLPLYCLV